MTRIIRTPFANMYQDKRFGSQLVTQGILWEKVEMLDRDGDWLKIRTPDTYQAWCQNFSTVELSDETMQAVERLPQLLIHTPFLPIFDNKELSGNRLAVAALGAKIPYSDRMDDLYKLVLPDGREGFCRQAKLPVMTQRETILYVANQLLGASYFWGGKSENGCDCSGLTQMCFSIAGIALLRDAGQQLPMLKDYPVKMKDALPGDLIFFKNEKGSIVHVAIMRNSPEYIHSSGEIKINSFDPASPKYLKKLDDMIEGIYSIEKLLRKD